MKCCEFAESGLLLADETVWVTSFVLCLVSCWTIFCCLWNFGDGLPDFVLWSPHTLRPSPLLPPPPKSPPPSPPHTSPLLFLFHSCYQHPLSATWRSSLIHAYVSSPTFFDPWRFSVLHISSTRHEFDFFFFFALSFCFGHIYYDHLLLFIFIYFFLLRRHRPNRVFSFLSPSVLACVCLNRILR